MYLTTTALVLCLSRVCPGRRNLPGWSRDPGGVQPLRLCLWELGVHCHDVRRSVCSPEDGLYKRDFSFLAFQGHQLSRFCLSPVHQLLCGWLLHHSPVFQVGETQAGSVLEFRKCITELEAMLLGFVGWVWCDENAAPNLPD